MVKQKFKSRLTLINAPAGSGKTTSIKEYIDYLTHNYPQDFSLCLTFTNRAVDELKSKIYSKNVNIYTIHEYCNQILSSFYKTGVAKEMFCELFEEQIENLLNSTEQKNLDKIEKYKSKYNITIVSKDIIKENIKEIKYNQTNFSSYLYGTLSHDDLLNFIYKFSLKYPKFLDIISKKYKFVFIDEYQDTSSNILKMIYNACIRNGQYLVLFGDKMQEIYNNYDGSFDEELAQFDTSRKLNINYRSSQEIVNVLNNIYNNHEYFQTSNIGSIGSKPQFIFSNDIMNVTNMIPNLSQKALQLYIANRERFEKIGVLNIFNAVSKIQDYKYGSKYEPTDILLDKSSDNPDTLIKLYFDLNEILELIVLENFGAALKMINNNKFFRKENFNIKKPKDKQNLKTHLNRFKEILLSNKSILEVLITLNEEQFILLDKLETILERDDYKELLNCCNIEFNKLYKYLEDKNISTQHGVKGESHDEVIMFIENSRSANPNVKMYDFLKLFTSLNINFEDYKKFVFDFKNNTQNIKDVFKDSSMWTSDNVMKYKDLLISTATQLLKLFDNNTYFITTKKIDDIRKYLTTHTVSDAKEAFSLMKIIGILNAYRLFYVGCSRARKKLIIVLYNKDVKDYKDALKNKMINIGFEEYSI